MDYWEWTKKDELYHHGILGQKWGKKNGPPYPLDSSDQSSSEKKAGWRKSLSKAANAAKNVASATKTTTGGTYDENRKAHPKDTLYQQNLDAMKKAGTVVSVVQGKDDKKAKKELAKAQKAWDKNFEKNWMDVYNEAADYANEVLIPQINEEYKDLIESGKSWDSPEYQAYEEEFQRRFDTLLQQKYDDVFGKRPE